MVYQLHWEEMHWIQDRWSFDENNVVDEVQVNGENNRRATSYTKPME